MLHLFAFEESVDPGNAFNDINCVPDQAVFSETTNMRVPEELPFFVGQAALINDASAARAQIVSPSLRATMNVDVEPVIAALVFGSPPEGIWHGDSPVRLDKFEAVNFSMLSDPAAAVIHRGLLILSDGAVSQVKGEIFTIRATAAITLATGTWVNGALTFGQTLPTGRYQIVGMRARGTNLVAARLVFIGGKFRPGVPALNAIGDLDPWWTRYGGMGVLGEFHTNNPPTVDCLGVTDTAQTFLFDLIKVG